MKIINLDQIKIESEIRKLEFQLNDFNENIISFHLFDYSFNQIELSNEGYLFEIPTYCQTTYKSLLGYFYLTSKKINKLKNLESEIKRKKSILKSKIIGIVIKFTAAIIRFIHFKEGGKSGDIDENLFLENNNWHFLKQIFTLQFTIHDKKRKAACH
jgi:hypothetical protein